MTEATLQRLTPLTNVAAITIVAGFRGSKPTRRVVHEAPGQANVVTTLGVAGTLRGTFEFIFGGVDAYVRARAALDSLAAGGVHRLNRPGSTLVHLVNFIAQGDVGLELDDTRKVWIVRAEWIEQA